MANQYRITTRNEKYRVEKQTLRGERVDKETGQITHVHDWLPISATLETLDQATKLMFSLIESDAEWTPVAAEAVQS